MTTSGTGPVTSHLSSLQTDPIRNFKFIVNIAHQVTNKQSGNKAVNLVSLGFTSLTGLAVSTNSIPYRQGGYNTTTQQIPGKSSFTPITLQRGLLLGPVQNWDWMRQLFDVQVGSGTLGVGQDFRAAVDILVLAHPVTNTVNLPVHARFHVYNAWPSQISYSDLNAGDDAFIVEQMTLVHEGFSGGVALTPSDRVNIV